MNNLDFQKILRAVEYRLLLKEYDAALGIITLLERHGFEKACIEQLSGDIFLLIPDYTKALQSYNNAVTFYTKNGKEQEALCVKTHIVTIEKQM